MQKLDDVTGDEIRLSVRQRELQRQATVAMINAQTVQMNTLTATVRELGLRLTILEAWQAQQSRPWYRRAWARLRKGW